MVRDLCADDLDAVQDAVDLLDEAGYHVDGIGSVERVESGIAADLTVRAHTRSAGFGADTSDTGDEAKGAPEVTAPLIGLIKDVVEAVPDDADYARPAEDLTVDTDVEGDATADAEHIDNGGGPDVAAADLPEPTTEGDPFHGADERSLVEVESDAGDDQPGDEDDIVEVVEDYGTFTTKDYGLALSGVQEHFDADRVTVVDREYGADLVPGVEDDGVDYAVSQSNIQLGMPGVQTIGLSPGEDVVAIPDGETVRLERADWEPEEEVDEDVPDEDPPEWTDYDGDATADGGASHRPYAPSDLGTYEVEEQTHKSRDTAAPKIEFRRPVGRAMDVPDECTLVRDRGRWFLEPGAGGRVDLSVQSGGYSGGEVFFNAAACREVGLEVGDEIVAHDAGGRVWLEILDEDEEVSDGS